MNRLRDENQCAKPVVDLASDQEPGETPRGTYEPRTVTLPPDYYQPRKAAMEEEFDMSGASEDHGAECLLPHDPRPPLSGVSS